MKLPWFCVCLMICVFGLGATCDILTQRLNKAEHQLQSMKTVPPPTCRGKVTLYVEDSPDSGRGLGFPKGMKVFVDGRLVAQDITEKENP